MVQFVEFGVSLLKKAANVRRDAALPRGKIVDLKRISKDLLQLSEHIEERMALLDRPQSLLTAVEMRLLEECKNCKAIGEEIAGSISKIQEREGGSNFRNLALLWEEKRIEEMELKLSETRANLMSTIMSDLW